MQSAVIHYAPSSSLFLVNLVLSNALELVYRVHKRTLVYREVYT